VTVSDPDGDELTVYFHWQNGTLIGSTTVNSGQVASIYLPDCISPGWLERSTTYRWYVTVNDSRDQIQSPVYSFTTRHQTDLNGDREVNILDISLLVMNYGEELEPGSAPWDVVPNGAVDIVDVSVLVMYYGESF
jgi:hypothetical protein